MNSRVNNPHPKSIQRVSPVQDRSRRKIDNILDATAKLLAAKGIEATTISTIAEEAKLSTAIVYHYFENRLAVFAALAQRTMAHIDQQLTSQLDVFSQSQQKSSRDILLYLYNLYRQTIGYAPLLSILRVEPSLQQLVKESNRRVADILCEVLIRRTPLSLRRAQRISVILSESCEQVLHAALLADSVEAEALIDELVEIVDALFIYYVNFT